MTDARFLASGEIMAHNGEAAAPAKEAGGMVSTKHGIVVLDFGGQYTQLIARRIREQQVFSAILPCTASVEEIRAQEPVGIVLSGGPSSVYDKDAPVCDRKTLDLGVPVLGICYGMQWLAHSLGGKVERAERREYGRARLDIKLDSKLFRGVPKQLNVWNSHGDHVAGLPEGFHVTARTHNAIAAVEHPASRFYGVEFHPEVNHTDCGADILRNFVFEVCGAKQNWNRAAFIAETVERICRQTEGAPRYGRSAHQRLRRYGPAAQKRIPRHS
jgi:GMP synthase (glutamine-hydrolysing)